MDRIAPTKRPEGRNAGRQRWRELLFVHYEVPVAALRPLVPEGLELDLLEGHALIGLVPFKMEKIAPPFVPQALGIDFLETNLRTYVHRQGEAPGVYFFSLEASSRLAVRVARRFFGLPYFDARMCAWREGDVMRYTTERRGAEARLEASFRVGRALGASIPGTTQHFLLERYLLYVERGGVMHVGQVHHAAYPAHEAELLSFEQTLTTAAGLPATAGPPAFVHYSPGVDVEVFATAPAPWRAR